MLRKIRIGISVVLFALITFYFLDFANILPNSFHRLAHIQFVPAVLSLSIGILIVLIALTLLFGRIYCSTICPMGIWQDVIARISKSVGKKKKRYRYSPAKNMLRWTVLGVTVIASVCGFSVVLGLLDPYSAYGRIVGKQPAGIRIFQIRQLHVLSGRHLGIKPFFPSYSDTDLCRHSYISMETWTHVV